MSWKHVTAAIILAITVNLSMPALAQMPMPESQFSMPYDSPGMGVPGMSMPGMASSGSGMPDSQTLQSQTLGGIDVNRGFEGMPALEARYRKAVVSNTLVFHKKMSSGRLAFGRHMDSQYYNTRYWEAVYVDGSQFWRVKDGVSKAEALGDFINPSGGKYKIDCAAAINLIMLKAKLDVVGESNFDRHLPVLLVRGWKTMTVKGGEAKEHKTLEMWAGNEYSPGGIGGLKIGDYAYFKNHPMMEGTPEQGENAIFLGIDQWGRPVFFGLNIGIMRGTVNQYGILSSERGSINPDSLKRMTE